MRILCISIFLLLFPIIGNSPSYSFTKIDRVEFKKADFNKAFQYILEHEGYWVNDPNDRGGETYCGITKKNYPNWRGWKYVEKYKRINKEIKWNTKIEGVELEFWVKDFYLDLWIKEDFYSLKDQGLANYIFDFRINGTKGVRVIQRTLRKFGYDSIVLNNRMTSEIISYINKVNKEEFLDILIKERTNYYKNIVKRDKSQKKFLKHWLYRSRLN